METKDLILRYGFAAGKRYTRNEKLRFLMGFTKELEDLGYRTEAKETVDNKFRNVNFYVGETDRARVVAAAYYDTPPVSFLPGGYRFFHETYRKKVRMLSVFVPMLVILAAGALFFWRSSAALFGEGGALSGRGVLNIAVLLLLLALMYGCRGGLGRRRNIVRNTSSILVLYRLAEQARGNRRLAFVLTDNGCGGDTGAKVLNGRKHKDQTVVHLDCVGAKEPLMLVLDSGSFSASALSGIEKLCEDQGICMADVKKQTGWKLDGFEPRELYLLSGTQGRDGFSLERRALSRVELSEENLEKTTAFLMGLEKVLR